MSNKKNLNKAIKSVKEENQKVALLIDKTKIPSNEYDKIILAYISIVLEHHRSIIELTNVRQLSALALVRPLYEAYIRANWLIIRVGSEKTYKAAIQLVNDIEDGKFPTLNVMCTEIDEMYNLIYDKNNQNFFSRDLENNKKIFHSYTHGGAYLISTIKNSHDKYTYKDMIDMLEHTTLYMFSVTLAYADTIGNLVLREKIRAIMLAKL